MMTYRQLLEVIEEAQRRKHYLNEFLEDYPPDSEGQRKINNWSEFKRLDALLDEQIPS